VFLEAWTEGEGKKDQDILGAAGNLQPRWPWPTTEDFADRFAEASRHLGCYSPGTGCSSR
jgi:hypothetical protein